MTASFASAIYHDTPAKGTVTSAISNASAKTGVDFGYLLQQAKVESNLNPNAKASSSSATGLYQFIDQTWLRMVKTYGAEHGLGKQANAITQTANGDFKVNNPSLRREILNLRHDATVSSLMAGEYASENADYLRSRTGREPNNTDLYMAHFLGAGGAGRFLNAMDQNAMMSGADLFPDAARANRGVFYKDGRALSLAQIYDRFDRKFGGTGQNDASVVFANATPTTKPTERDFQTAAKQYGTIPGVAFFTPPQMATAYLPDYTQNTYEQNADNQNPLGAILSVPFKILSHLFG